MFGMMEAMLSFLRRQVGLRTDAADAAGSLHAKIKALHGFQEWTTPGTYYWTVPPNVTRIKYLIFGGGGGGGGGAVQGGGGGGYGAGAINELPVSPGETLEIVVGAGGVGGAAGSDSINAGNGGNGGESRIKRPNNIRVIARGGSGGIGGTISSTFIPAGGGNGIAGPFSMSVSGVNATSAVGGSKGGNGGYIIGIALTTAPGGSNTSDSPSPSGASGSFIASGGGGGGGRIVGGTLYFGTGGQGGNGAPGYVVIAY